MISQAKRRSEGAPEEEHGQQEGAEDEGAEDKEDDDEMQAEEEETANDCKTKKQGHRGEGRTCVEEKIKRAKVEQREGKGTPRREARKKSGELHQCMMKNLTRRNALKSTTAKRKTRRRKELEEHRPNE